MERAKPSTEVQTLLGSQHVPVPGCVPPKQLEIQPMFTARVSSATNRTKMLPETDHVSKGVNILHDSFLMLLLSFFLPHLLGELRKFISQAFACLFILDPILSSGQQEQPALIWNGLIKTYFVPVFGLERQYFPIADGLCVKWPIADGLITSASLEEFCTCWKSHPKGICFHDSFTSTPAKGWVSSGFCEVSGYWHSSANQKVTLDWN